MKKIALMVLLAAFAASPAVAATATKHKKTKKMTEAEQIAQQHDHIRRAVRDALRWCCRPGHYRFFSALIWIRN